MNLRRASTLTNIFFVECITVVKPFIHMRVDHTNNKKHPNNAMNLFSPIDDCISPLFSTITATSVLTSSSSFIGLDWLLIPPWRHLLIPDRNADRGRV